MANTHTHIGDRGYKARGAQVRGRMALTSCCYLTTRPEHPRCSRLDESALVLCVVGEPTGSCLATHVLGLVHGVVSLGTYSQGFDQVHLLCHTQETTDNGQQ